MSRNLRGARDGKERRPRTRQEGKRLHCAICRKRSPRKVFTPAPWYCPGCAAARAAEQE